MPKNYKKKLLKKQDGHQIDIFFIKMKIYMNIFSYD